MPNKAQPLWSKKGLCATRWPGQPSRGRAKAYFCWEGRVITMVVKNDENVSFVDQYSYDLWFLRHDMFVPLIVVVTLVMIVVIIIICVTLVALTLCCLLLIKLTSSLNHCASWCCSGFFQIVMLYKVQRTPWFPLRTLYQALPRVPKGIHNLRLLRSDPGCVPHRSQICGISVGYCCRGAWWSLALCPLAAESVTSSLLGFIYLEAP